MQATPLNETEAAVEAYSTQDCGIKYSVNYAGETRKDDWACDSWRFNLNLTTSRAQDIVLIMQQQNATELRWAM